MQEQVNLLLGNNLDLIKTLSDNSVSSIVTDPPYEIGFMNKGWDSSGIAYNVDLWKECLRVLKPGGHMLAFSGTRTYHRMACAIEDAGFEIRDQIQWIYGSGFPKGMNILNKILEKCKECLNKEFAQTVIQTSKHVINVKDFVVIPVAILPEARKAFLIQIGKEVSILDQTDTLLLESMLTSMNLNIELLWKNSSEEHWKEMSKYITSTEFVMTTDQKIYNFLQSKNTQDYIIKEKIFQNGLKLNVLVVDQNSKGKKEKLNDILGLFATGNATREIVEKFNGKNVALKPANEPICVARKPISEKTIAENVLKHGTGGINIDDCRIKTDDDLSRKLTDPTGWKNSSKQVGSINDDWKKGRWAANIMFDEDAAAALDEQTGSLKSGTNCVRRKEGKFIEHGGLGKAGDIQTTYGDVGGASRFFYCSKTSTKERNSAGKNNHPTVKPIKLMEYLVKLVTPKDGVVMDIFMGSGSTGIAAKMSGYKFIGMELNKEYFDIAKKRIDLIDNSKSIDDLFEEQD